MRSRVLFGFILLGSIILPLFSQEQEPLGDTARRLRSENTASQESDHAKTLLDSKAKLASYTSPDGPYLTADVTPDTSKPIDSNNPLAYQVAVRELLSKENFAELDLIAARERHTKSRFPGGGWKLYTFYNGLCGSNCEASSEPELLSTIEHLKHWVAANPQSITARIALANAYYDYAWLGRGPGYSDTVNEAGWKSFIERILLARTTLEEAAGLDEKCPHWYYLMLMVMRSQQADLSEMSALLEKAYSFEPLYYYYFSDYAFTLQPMWDGEEGDSERFAEAISEKIGGDEGAITYFNIAADLNCVGCSESESGFSRMSWPKMQEGYAALERRYGLSKLKLNAFAYLAVRAQDHAVATRAFLRIGPNWDQSVWREKAYFDSSRGWALAPPPEIVKFWSDADRSVHTEGGVQYMQQTVAAFQQNNAALIKDCTQFSKYDTEPFWVLMKLDQNGDAHDVTAWPPTQVSACVLPKLVRHAGSRPPSTPFWLILPLMEKRVPEPVAHRIRGAMFPDSIATTPLPSGILGDLNADAATDPEAMAKYVVAVRDLLQRNKFDELDKIANIDRNEKLRFAGGIWKLYVLYQALKQPAEGLKAAEPVWQDHINTLKGWVATRPDSITARVALAEALLNYTAKIFSEGDKPRSDGQDPWSLTNSVRHLVDLVMLEASELKTKCPHLFFVKLEIQALNRSDDLPAAFEEAISFEPEYVPYYRLYAIYRRPEWSGEPGDAEKFADEISSRVRDKKGRSLFFDIAAALNVSPATRYFPTLPMQWEQIQAGYTADEELYGPSVYNLNQLAFLAIRYQKFAVAKELFVKLGDQWNFETWKSQNYFEFAKEYVTPPADIAVLRLTHAANLNTPEGRQYRQAANYEIGTKLAPVLSKCFDRSNHGPIRGNDLYIKIGSDGTIQEVKSWPDTRSLPCVTPTLLNSRISRPPAPSYWLMIPFAPTEGSAAFWN